MNWISRYVLFWLEHFLFCFYIFIWFPILILIIIIMIILIITVAIFIFVRFTVIIISSFSMLLTFVSLVFNILFYVFVYIECFWILDMCCSRTFFKVCKKDTETISVSLMWTLNSVFLNYCSDDFLLKWLYYILNLTFISFILYFLI